MTNTNTHDKDFPTYPTFYGTMINSPQWKEWVNYNKQMNKWDVWESEDTGWLSPEHFQAFMFFFTNPAVPESHLTSVTGE